MTIKLVPFNSQLVLKPEVELRICHSFFTEHSAQKLIIIPCHKNPSDGKMIHESSKKILVIEDDAITRNLFLEVLEAQGFDTIGAEDGLAGIEQAQKHLPDLVICDIQMPDMDGYSVLTTLRQDPDTAIIPFIFFDW